MVRRRDLSEPKLVSPRAQLTFAANLNEQIANDTPEGVPTNVPKGGIFRFVIERAELVNLKKRIHAPTGLKLESVREEDANEFNHSGVA